MFAAIYALILGALPVDRFVDRDSYLAYVDGSLAILVLNSSNGIAGLLTNEPLWLLVNILFSSFLDTENCVRAIIGISAFLVAFVTLRNNPRHIFLLVLFLLLPQVLKNYVIHLRQGLAIAVFMAGWFSISRSWRWTLIMMCPFIHASFFFIILFMFLDKALVSVRLSASLRLFNYVAAGLLFSFSATWLAGALGARQGDEYQAASVETSGIGFLFWLLFTFLYILQGSRFMKANAVSFSVLVFYLTGYFFLPVAARIFESALLLILLSGLKLTSYRKLCFFMLFGLYFIAQWLPRLSSPGFGWGVENYM